MTHATLHYYFPTKEALIEAVIDYAVFQKFLAGMPLFAEGRIGTPDEQLKEAGLPVTEAPEAKGWGD